jgi:hypothetical protein
VAQNLALINQTFAPSFTAAQGSALTCPTNSSPATASGALTLTQYSWAGWFRASTTPGNTTQEFFHADTTKGLFGFDWGNQSNPTFGSQAAFHMLSNGNFVNARIPDTLSANTWYWVGATYNGSQLRIFLNGQFRATAAATSMASIGGAPNLCPIWASGTGNVDELKIWNAPLTDAQMLTEYQSYGGQQPARRVTHRRAPGG